MEYLNGMGAKKQGFKQESGNIVGVSTGTLWQTLLVPCLISFTLLLTNKILIFFLGCNMPAKYIYLPRFPCSKGWPCGTLPANKT